VDIKARLAKNLRELRQAKGLSQEQFAFEVQIHRTYISDLERAARNPTVTIVEKLAKSLGVTASDLLK
jgi:transcriptional regulator with XRE-family HTH domain